MTAPISMPTRATAVAARRWLCGLPTRARQIATAGGHPHAESGRRALVALVLAALLVGSMLSPLAVGGAAAAGAGSGLEPIPEYNFGADAGMDVATDAGAWNAHASRYEGSTEVQVTSDAGQLVLVAGDDRHHAGRDVAVSASTLEAALGERPSMAHGSHSSGDSWTSAVEYRDGFAVVSIPQFSENKVTFSGTVSLTGNPAESGTSYTYDLADSEEVDNFTATLTGSENRANATTAETHVANGESVPFSVGGTTDPDSATVSMTGRAPGRAGSQLWQFSPSSGDVDALVADNGLVFSGHDDGSLMATDTDSEANVWGAEYGSGVTTMLAANGDLYVGFANGTVISHNPSDGSVNWQKAIHTSTVHDIDSDGSGTVYTASDDNSVRATDIADQSEVWSNTHATGSRGVAYHSGDVYYTVSDGTLHAVDASMGSDIWTVNTDGTALGEVAASSGGVFYHDGDSYDGVRVDPSDGSEIWRVPLESSISKNLIATSDFFVHNSAENVYVRAVSDGRKIYESDDSGRNGDSVAIDDSASAVYLGDRGNDVTKYEHEPGTYDPQLDLNGNTVLSHSGVLYDGETVYSSVSVTLGNDSVTVSTQNSTTVDPTIKVEEITETIDPSISVNGEKYEYYGTLADGETTELAVSAVSLTTGENVVNVSVSEDYGGPIGHVGLDYSHAAIDEQTVDYAAEAWSERYNLSKTFASDRSDVSLTIPHAGTVLNMREIETRVDGGSWSTVSSQDYSLDNTTLTVNLGDVLKGSTVDVRTSASKVTTTNGEITVIDPTVLSDDLSSEIQIDEHAAGFEIGVGPTVDGNEIHYTHSESWGNPQSHARIDSDGSQALRLPNAGAGETARVSTIPLEASPADGHVDIRLRSSGSEPEFKILDSSSTSEVEFSYLAARSGSSYQLYSVSGDHEIDRSDGTPPVLKHDGNAEILSIYELGTGSGGGAGAFGPETASTPPTMLIGLALAGLIAIYLISRRLGDDSVSGGMVLGAAAVLVGLLSIQGMAPGIIARSIGGALEEALPLVLLGAVVIIVIWLRSRGDDVTLEIGGDRR